MKPILKPCPFCGCKPVRSKRNAGPGAGAYIIRCKSVRCPVAPETLPCNMSGVALDRDRAAEVWNRRASI